MKKIILIILLIILIAAGAALLKKRRKTVATAPMATPLTYTIKTVEAETRTVSQTNTFLAKLESAKSSEISSKLSGRISALLVRESQEIRQGDLLVRIDDQEILAGIDALRAQLSSARKQREYSKTQLERNLALFEVGGLSQEKLEGSEVAQSTTIAAVKELEQKIRGFKNQLDYSNIRAPFDGIVGTIFLHQGDLATPGRALLTLNSLPQKLTFSFMPGTDEILCGQAVLLDGDKTAKITTLYNDARNGLSVAEIALEQRLIRPNGSYLTIAVVIKTATGCSVPIQALLHRKLGVSVMLYREGRFTEKSVIVKALNKTFAVIDPAIEQPVAIAAEAKLSLLPSYGNIKVHPGEKNE